MSMMHLRVGEMEANSADSRIANLEAELSDHITKMAMLSHPNLAKDTRIAELEAENSALREDAKQCCCRCAK